MAVALDQQFRTQKKGIIEERIPILHPSSMEQHYFVTYVPLPTTVEDAGAIEMWTERITFICDDLTWLLQQNHAKFWCEAAFNKDFHSMLDSYLRYAPRPQRSIASDIYSVVPNSKELENKLSRLMFLCILRLSTHKESSDNFFTPEGFGKVIYDNYIFDIPRLFDIGALYGVNNKELLSKMIGNVFKQQPSYTGDLHNAIRSIKDVITKRIEVFHTQTGPKKLSAATTVKTSRVDEIIDLMFYILDLTCTINRFCSVYPDGREIFFAEHFHRMQVRSMLVDLFETFLRIFERVRESNDMSDYLNIYEETKYETVNLFNNLLASCCIEPLFVQEDKAACFQSFIDILAVLIAEKRFVAAYEDYFSLEEQIDIIHQTIGLLDDAQIKFYTDGIKQAIELHGTPSCKQKLQPPSKTPSTNNAAIKKSTDPNVQKIKDFFPDLDESYIQACLKHYKNNVDQIVNDLFDNNVPDYVTGTVASTTTHSITTSSATTVKESPFDKPDLPFLEQRLNVYDGDEFDVFNRDDVDLTRIHKGKKARDSPADLDDKSHLDGMRERYSRLGLIADVTDDDYDDEYDDTYDDNLVDVRDADDPIGNELTGKQPGHYRRNADEEESDSGDEENNANQARRRAQFVENPEVVRERQAQRRAAWQQTHQPHRTHAEQQHDVVGNARGRGQASTVVHNRRWKGTHKGAQANHHRRDRAAQKANRGLLS